MADRGHELTDELLHDLEGRVADEYARALKDMERKLQAHLEKFDQDDAVQRKLLDDGKITQQEYKNWRYRHMMMNKRWEEMRDVLAADMHNANEIALRMAYDEMPDVYALNANYALYDIEHGGRIYTGLTLYNHDTAEYLLRQQRQLMPGPSGRKAAEIAANKDLQWNQKKIQSAVLQGVLQGESPFAVAQRLMSVAQMNYNAAVRYARTMTTSAQNAGRYDSYHRAKDLGVDLTIEWQATLDMHTRHDHRMMHGQRRELDEPFNTPDGYTIYYPADSRGISTAPQSQIWNCRCTLRPWVKGFEGKTVTESPGMEGLSFEEWRGERNMSSQNNSGLAPLPGSVISREELEKFASFAESKGLRFAPSPRGIDRPKYGGFENYRGDVEVLYQIASELDYSKRIWPDRLLRKGVLIGYESLGNTNDFAYTAGRTIFFNKDIYDDTAFLKQSYRNAVKSGTFVKGTTVAAVPWHELGHVFQNLNSRLYGKMETAIQSRGEMREIGLQLTSRYGINESRDGEYTELLSELLSASRSRINKKRQAALAILKEVL